MGKSEYTREQLGRDAMSILTAVRDNARAGRSNKLADVRGAIEKSLALEFETAYAFLRKSGFIALGRDASLKLTAEGEKGLDPESRGRFEEQVAAQCGDLAAPPEAQSSAGAAGGSSAGDPKLALVAGGTAAARAAGRTGAEGSRSDARASEADSRYIKYDALGQGPLATVYRGRHTALGLDVAIKELKDIFSYFAFLQRAEVIKRLKREICAQAVVRHPSVVAVLDQSCDAQRPFFVTELCMGGNLRQRLEAAGAKGLPAPEALRLFLQMAYGLRAAHAQGLVHGNLKPENVLLDNLGNARIADFGMARVIESDATRGMPQLFVGNVAYMSPEQIAQSKELGPAADVYAAGILLYEMLTGRVPGRRAPMPSQANGQISAKLDALFDRMTQDSREERYPDFDAVLSEFYAAFEDGSWLKQGDLVLSSGAGVVSRLQAEPPAPRVSAS